MRIAISGTIGSGKTTVCNYLRSKGFEIFDCDKCNANLLEKGNVGYQKLVENFDNILDANLNINKKLLAQQVFSNDQKLKLLNDLMHPLILERMELIAQNKEPFIAEVPLLFETEFKNHFDYKLLIATDETVAITRLRARGFSQKEAKARLNKQMNVATKIKLADYVIYNNGDLVELHLKVDEWLERMHLC